MEGSRGDVGGASVRAGAGEREHAISALGQGIPGENTAVGQRLTGGDLDGATGGTKRDAAVGREREAGGGRERAAVEHELPGGGGTGSGTEVGVISDGDGAARDGGDTAVIAEARERQGTIALLGEGACATDYAGELRGVGAIEDERGVVGDGTGEQTGGPAGADLERTGRNGGATEEGAGAGEREGS